MNFLYFTDVHFKGTNPESRKDNYAKAILQKLYFITDYALDNNYNLLVCGGDLFDGANVADGVKTDLIKWAKYTHDKGLPILHCIGSHDYLDYNLRSFDKTSLGNLAHAGLITIIPEEGYEYEDVRFEAVHHTAYLEDDLNNFAMKKVISGMCNIQIVHGMVLDKPAVFKHVLIKDLPVKKMGNLVLCGHYHTGFEQVMREGVIFINPGSVARKERTERLPNLLAVSVENNQLDMQLIPIPCEKDVFKEGSKAVMDVEREHRMTDFLENLTLQSEISVASDPMEVMVQVAKEFNKSEQVINFLRNKMNIKINEVSA